MPFTPEQILQASNEARRPLLYIAGPILSSGNPFVNVQRAISAASRAADRGWLTFIPHLNAFASMSSNALSRFSDEMYWITLDFAVLDRCDALLRLPGKSSGADAEVARAEVAEIPIYRGLKELPTVTSFDSEGFYTSEIQKFSVEDVRRLINGDDN